MLHFKTNYKQISEYSFSRLIKKFIKYVLVPNPSYTPLKKKKINFPEEKINLQISITN